MTERYVFQQSWRVKLDVSNATTVCLHLSFCCCWGVVRSCSHLSVLFFSSCSCQRFPHFQFQLSHRFVIPATLHPFHPTRRRQKYRPQHNTPTGSLWTATSRIFGRSTRSGDTGSNQSQNINVGRRCCTAIPSYWVDLGERFIFSLHARGGRNGLP